MTGVFVDIMCSVNPEYTEHVIYEVNRKGKRVKQLYVRVLRALYGCIESALLWYELYSSTLQDMGFELNPYDKCVANKLINGKQCTIVFYVDDNKVSHADPTVVTQVLDQIANHFGELSITRGARHDFLGMNIEIKDKKVYIDMKHQVEEALEWGGVQEGTKPATPATKELYNDAEHKTLLDSEQSDTYHSVVQKLMYLCKRARPDIEPVLSYLCTKVSKPNQGDKAKLDRVLDYLKATKDDERIIGATSLDKLMTWVDASYAIHDNMRSHTGGMMSFGIGALHTKSTRQKLNTKSSTEAELVVVSEYLPYHIWLINFLEHQGYRVEKKLLFQDNESTIKMEVNGRNSCTGNSRHVDIRFFFVHDRVKTGKVDVVYCPTDKMVADFFTKPLQGSIFKKFRASVMGHNVHDLSFM